MNHLILNSEALRASCAHCSMHQLCLPMGLNESEIQHLDQIIGRRRRVLKGGALYRMNDSFTNLYAIRLGHFKTTHINPKGEEQITGFQMAGELLGMDAISADLHHCNAIALEDSEVCEIPFPELEKLLINIPTLLHHFHRIMSQEITREQHIMLLLGNMRAQQKLAVFLVNLSSRYAARGYSETRVKLRMSREEIGSYLGLTIESISRLFSMFKKEGWITIHSRELEILNLVKLKDIATGLIHCS